MKIIFVGSADFSGSTMLDMMLGNGPDCFACGEVYALFKEKDIGCSCGKGNDCPVWSPIKEMGNKHFHKDLNSKMVSDSSKVESWIESHYKFGDHVILIYKHPLNYLFSCYKRGHQSIFQVFLRLWCWWVYYPKMLRKFPNAIVVSYKDLSKNPSEILNKICSLVGIKYFPGKEFFWEEKHHVLYGSGSARTHLYGTDSELYKKRSGEEVEFHQSIYYSDRWETEIPSWYYRLFFLVESTYRDLEKRRSVRVGVV